MSPIVKQIVVASIAGVVAALVTEAVRSRLRKG